MAKKTVGKLNVILNAVTGPFQKKMKGAGRDIRGFQKTVGRSIKKLAGFGAAIAGIGGAAGFASAIKSSLDAADALGKTSAKLGVATERLAGLQLAGQATGVSINTMNMAIQRMTRRVSEAAVGTGEAKGAIRELGIDAKKLATLPLDQAFIVVARAMEKVSASGDKVRLAMKLFDSEGVALVNTLGLGEKGLTRFMNRASDLGLALTKIETRQVENMTNQVLFAKAAFQGLATQVGITMIPLITSAADKFASLSKFLRKNNDAVLKGIGRFLKLVLQITAAAVAAVAMIRVIKKIVTAFRALAKAMTITQALGGPPGWIALAAGVAAATGAVIAVDKAFDSVGSAIQDAGGDLITFNADIDKLTANVPNLGRAFKTMSEDVRRFGRDLQPVEKSALDLITKIREETLTVGLTGIEKQLELFRLKGLDPDVINKLRRDAARLNLAQIGAGVAPTDASSGKNLLSKAKASSPGSFSQIVRSRTGKDGGGGRPSEVKDVEAQRLLVEILLALSSGGTASAG